MPLNLWKEGSRSPQHEGMLKLLSHALSHLQPQSCMSTQCSFFSHNFYSFLPNTSCEREYLPLTCRFSVYILNFYLGVQEVHPYQNFINLAKIFSLSFSFNSSMNNAMEVTTSFIQICCNMYCLHTYMQ